MDKRAGFLIAALTLCAPAALAHHSGAMFDRQKKTTIVGVVKEFQWTSPHCWLQVSSAAADTSGEWSLEMGAPIELYRGGWSPKILKPGDKITVVLNPARDGTRSGLFVSAVDGDGHPIGGHKQGA